MAPLEGGRTIALSDDALAEILHLSIRPPVTNTDQIFTMAPHAMVAQPALLLVMERLCRHIDT